jgi:hypothetical protein
MIVNYDCKIRYKMKCSLRSYKTYDVSHYVCVTLKTILNYFDNALAYCKAALITAVKSFLGQAAWEFSS